MFSGFRAEGGLVDNVGAFVACSFSRAFFCVRKKIDSERESVPSETERREREREAFVSALPFSCSWSCFRACVPRISL